MLPFKNFFTEALGKFKKPASAQTIARGVNIKSPYSDEELERRQNLIDTFRGSRRADYPSDAFNFVLTDTFKNLITDTWNTLDTRDPVAFIIYGDPGVGKSQIIKQAGRDLTKLENKYFKSTEPDGTPVERKFVEWNKLDTNAKNDVMKHPERYYVFLDIRAAYFTTASLEGLPVRSRATVGRNIDNDLSEIESDEFFDVIPQRFISFITNPKTAGVLFLDEINQASTEVKQIFLQVILDREFKDLPMSSRVLILAASNIGQAFRGQDFNPALASRFKGAVLIPDPEEWFKYAQETGIDDYIIQFARQNPETNFYKYPDSGGKNVQFPNPRSLVRFNTEFKNILNQFDEVRASGDAEAERKFNFIERVQTEAASYLGAIWAREFVDELKKTHEFDIPTLAADEEKYKALGSANQKRLATALITNILSEIDDAVIEGKEVPFDSTVASDIMVPEVDAAKLTQNIANSGIIVKRLNDDDFNFVIKEIKKRYKPFAYIFVDELAKDKATLDRIVNIINTIERVGKKQD